MEFDPFRNIENAEGLRRIDGSWPNFHDAIVHRILFDKGDMRPEDDVWVGAWVMIEFETLAEQRPERIVMKFHDCDRIQLANFNHSNDIIDLEFAFEHRGYFADGKTPLPPFIRAKLAPGYGVALEMLCFRVEVLPGWDAGLQPQAT